MTLFDQNATHATPDKIRLQPGEFLYSIRVQRGLGGLVYSQGTTAAEAMTRAGIDPEAPLRPPMPIAHRPLTDKTDEEKQAIKDAKAERGRENLRRYREKQAEQNTEPDPQEELAL